MAIFEPTETWKKIQALGRKAESLLEEKEGDFPARNQLKRLARFLLPPLIEKEATLDIPTGVTQMPPMGMTKIEALKDLLHPMKFGAKYPGGQEQVRNAAKILLATPRKAMAELKGIKYIPGLSGGQYRTKHHSPPQTIEIQTWDKFRKDMPEQLYTMLDHELQHLIQDTMPRRVFGRGSIYNKAGGSIEALTDWMAKRQAAKVGLPYRSNYIDWYGREDASKQIRDLAKEHSLIWDTLSAIPPFKNDVDYFMFTADFLDELIRGAK